jgi:hypothetical protein
MKSLKIRKKLELLLGFVNFLCDFILLYACIVGLLERLRKMKKIPKDIWENQDLRVFKSLKKVLLKVLVLQESN